jgi:hypothetical protein
MESRTHENLAEKSSTQRKLYVRTERDFSLRLKSGDAQDDTDGRSERDFRKSASFDVAQGIEKRPERLALAFTSESEDSS